MLQGAKHSSQSVFHNVTTSSSGWVVNNNIILALSISNHNALRECSATLVQSMEVSVIYASQLIAKKESTFGFALKLRESFFVPLQRKSEHIQIDEWLGRALEKDLEFPTNITLKLDTNTLYYMMDRKRSLTKRAIWNLHGA